MSIELHCPQCQKSIKAPDSAGGKHGKCPYCKASVYIPNPHDNIEILSITPIDEEEARHDEELRHESARFAAAIGHVTDGATQSDADEHPQAEFVEVESDVNIYIRSMHTSKLEDAQAAMARLKTGGKRSRKYLNELLEEGAELPFGDVPKPLALGFLRKLLTRIS